VPAAWVIEPQGREWVALVRSHGFEIERLSRAASLEVGAYPAGAAARLPAGIADDLPLDSAPDASRLLMQVRRDLPVGSWVVRSTQPGVRLLFTLLEPWSEDAPLSREPDAAHGPDDRVAAVGGGPYPVYRIAEPVLERLQTEVVPSPRGRPDGAG
jgi:hypothetical protein